jgi:hypothetical protein
MKQRSLKEKNMTKMILPVFLLFASGSVFADMTCPPGISKDICQFEAKVYTDTDFKNTQDVRGVLTQFKSLLMAHSSDSAMVQEHLLSLGNQIVEESYSQRAPKEIVDTADGDKTLLKMFKSLREWEAKNGEVVPLDWRLPDGFVTLVLTLNRSYDVSTDRVRFGLGAYGVLDQPIEIEQFKISKYSGDTIIDKEASIGSWDYNLKSSLGQPAFSASSMIHSSPTPVPDGLYLLTIKVKGQNAVNGWFFLHGTCATSPVVLSPQVNEKLHTSEPTIRFQDFRSSSKLTSDHQKRIVSISREGDGKTVWHTSAVNPKNVTDVTVGKDPNETGDTNLSPGAYRLNLSFEERSFFGMLLIGRAANTTVTFGVTK